MSNEFQSYADDALDDLRKEQERSDLALERKHDIHIRRLQNFKFLASRMGVGTAIVIVLILIVLGAHVLYVHEAAQGKIEDAYWVSQCTGAGGGVLYGDTSTSNDNVCVFPNGFQVRQHSSNG